jgi:hypothetical protein
LHSTADAACEHYCCYRVDRLSDRQYDTQCDRQCGGQRNIEPIVQYGRQPDRRYTEIPRVTPTADAADADADAIADIPIATEADAADPPEDFEPVMISPSIHQYSITNHHDEQHHE